MSHSIPKRHSLSPFRRHSSNHVEQQQSLRIDTKQQQVDTNTTRSPSRVRQRLSSIFRTSSPVVMTLKDTFNISTPNLTEQKRLSTFSLFKQDSMEEVDDQSSSESSDSNSDHSPTDWETVGVPYSTYTAERKPSISLAYHVNQILGSTLDQVDEEIDQDWEDSRSRLRQSLQINKKILI